MTREEKLEAALMEIAAIPNMRDENNQRIHVARSIAVNALGGINHQSPEEKSRQAGHEGEFGVSGSPTSGEVK